MHALSSDSSVLETSAALPADQTFDSTAHTLQLKWSAIQDAAIALRILAGLRAWQPSAEIQDFPEAILRAGGWRLDHAARAVDDLAAVMEQGLAALLSARARGRNASAAAVALWREFDHAAAAILGLMPPSPETA